MLTSVPDNDVHASHLPGRDKFVDIDHPWMPASLPQWQRALSTVSRTRPARRGPDLWGYWIPEPALLLGPKTEERTLRYLGHWLRMRTLEARSSLIGPVGIMAMYVIFIHVR